MVNHKPAVNLCIHNEIGFENEITTIVSSRTTMRMQFSLQRAKNSSKVLCTVSTFGGRTESFPFPFLSQGIFGEKPFPEFLKAFPDLKVIGKTFPATSKTFPSR